MNFKAFVLFVACTALFVLSVQAGIKDITIIGVAQNMSYDDELLNFNQQKLQLSIVWDSGFVIEPSVRRKYKDSPGRTITGVDLLIGKQGTIGSAFTKLLVGYSHEVVSEPEKKNHKFMTDLLFVQPLSQDFEFCLFSSLDATDESYFIESFPAIVWKTADWFALSLEGYHCAINGYNEAAIGLGATIALSHYKLWICPYQPNIVGDDGWSAAIRLSATF